MHPGTLPTPQALPLLVPAGRKPAERGGERQQVSACCTSTKGSWLGKASGWSRGLPLPVGREDPVSSLHAWGHLIDHLLNGFQIGKKTCSCSREVLQTGSPPSVCTSIAQHSSSPCCWHPDTSLQQLMCLAAGLYPMGRRNIGFSSLIKTKSGFVCKITSLCEMQ